MITFPEPSVATHSEVVGQEAERMVPTGKLVTVHAAAPPVGCVEVATVPKKSNATQNVVEGHDIAK